MALEIGQKVRVIGQIHNSTIVEIFGTDRKTYKIKSELGDVELTLPADAIAPLKAPIHWYIYEFRKHAWQKRQHIILIGKPKKKPFIAVYASDYNDLNTKRDAVYHKLKGTRRISWFLQLEIDLSVDPNEIEPPPKPADDWYVETNRGRPFQNRSFGRDKSRSAPLPPRRIPRDPPQPVDDGPRRAPRALPPLSPKSTTSTPQPPPPPPKHSGNDVVRPKRPRIKKPPQPPIEPPSTDSKPE